MEKGSGRKIVTLNRSVRHDYFVLEAIEAGIELAGTEVKSIRAGNVNLKDAWCVVENGEIFVKGMHVSPYEQGNIFNKDPIRPRRLLLHKNQIRHLFAEVKQQGLTLVPLSLYFKNSNLKLEVGLCRGKKLYDKRADAAKRDAFRDVQRAVVSKIRS